MYQYDEEVSDILAAHGMRILTATLKVMTIVAIFCVGLRICSGWIPASQSTTIPLVVRNATAAAREAGVAVAVATRDVWVEATPAPPALDASRP